MVTRIGGLEALWVVSHLPFTRTMGYPQYQSPHHQNNSQRAPRVLTTPWCNGASLPVKQLLVYKVICPKSIMIRVRPTSRMYCLLQLEPLVEAVNARELRHLTGGTPKECSEFGNPREPPHWAFRNRDEKVPIHLDGCWEGPNFRAIPC